MKELEILLLVLDGEEKVVELEGICEAKQHQQDVNNNFREMVRKNRPKNFRKFKEQPKRAGYYADKNRPMANKRLLKLT